MTTDTKAIIGTILAAAIGISGLLSGLIINRIGNVETEVRSLNERIDSVHSELRAQIDDRIEGLRSEQNGLRSELNGRMDRLRDELLENYHRLDTRMRTIEQGFARIDQRLDTLERAIIPSAEPAQ